MWNSLADCIQVYVSGVGRDFDPSSDVYQECECEAILYVHAYLLTSKVAINTPYIMQVRKISDHKPCSG